MPIQWKGHFLSLFLMLCLVSLASAFSPPGTSAAQTGVDCSLLDDPVRRAMMSSAFELMLLEECGRLDEEVPLPPLGPVPPPVYPIPDVVPPGGPDARVNAVDDPPEYSTAQSETSIALNADTGTICITWNDIYHNYQGLGICGFSRSTDGGVTWEDGGAMPPGPGDNTCRGDPSVAWRAADGYFYYASLDNGGSGPNGMSLWRSTDDCASFQWYDRVITTGYEDKELMAVENNSASPYYGRIYLAWLGLDTELHYFAYSDDTLNWSTPVVISDPTERPGGAFPVVAPNGDVYVGWASWHGFPFGPVDQDIVRSIDGGDSFSWVTSPITNSTPPRDPTAEAYCNFIAIRAFMRYLPSLQIAITPGDLGDPNDYCLHVIYPYDPDGYGVGDAANVYYRRSCDYGDTWEPEVMLNDDGGLTDQFYPSLAANENGAVVASWYDRRNDPGFNYYFERWATVSYDGGDTWEPNRRIGDVVSPVYIDSLAFCYHGDYDLMAADENYAYIVWADGRVYYNGHYDQDIWFDRLPLWPDFDLQALSEDLDLCRPDTVTTTLDVGSIFFYDQPVILSDSGVPAGVSTSFSTNPVAPLPGSSIYTIDVTAGAADGSYAWLVSGDSPTLTHGVTVTLVVNSAIPAGPTLAEPPDGATDLPLGHILFQWSDLPEATSYHLQVDDDPAFGSPEADVGGIETNSYDLPGQLDPSTTYYWRVSAANGCGESTFSGEFSFITAPPCILLVDDDNDHPDMEPYYIDALNILGYAYDVFDVGGGTGNGPTLDEMEDYAIVIWFSGDKVGGGAGPNPTDEVNLSAYLNGGGHLFLSSQDYLADYGLTSFGYNYLGIASYTNDGSDPRVFSGQAGDPIGNGQIYFPTYPPDFVERGDIVNPGAGTLVAFQSRTGENLALDKDGGVWKTVFFANSWVPLHFLEADPNAEVLGRIVDWFGGCPDLQPAIVVEPLSLEATLYADERVTHTLWISNEGTAELTFALHEMSRTVTLQAAPPLRPQADPLVDPDVRTQIQADGQARVLIYLRELPDLSLAKAIHDWEARGRFVYQRLLETVEHSGGELTAWLVETGADPRQLLTVNAIAATVDAAMLDTLAARSEVARIGPNRVLSIPSLTPEEQVATVKAVEWNIAKIRADQVWDTFGVTGEGVTVGDISTGVLYSHPALVEQYRGNQDGSFDHNYNWFDLVNGQPEPYDSVGAGTYGVGIVVGDDGGSNQVGVAPGAEWIAVKACEYSCTIEDLHAALAWMLAPTDLGGSNPDPSKRPHVGLNGWGGSGCDTEFLPDLQIWWAAGILPVFAPGGSSLACYSIGSPADLSASFAAGATDAGDNISSSSSFGPSCWGDIKPDVTAPGVSVRSSWNDGGYNTLSTTTGSTAHLAGTAALVLSADPSLDLLEVRAIITDTALCIEDLRCDGTPCPDGANSVYGWGRIDAFEAVALALGTQVYDIPWLFEEPISGVVPPGEGMPIAITFDSAGLDPGDYLGLLDVESDDPTTPHVGVPVTLTVLPPCEPVHGADFSWEPITPIAGQVVTLTATAMGTPPISYNWDLGDGTFVEGQVASHSYDLAGSYTVVLTATNCATATDTATHTIIVVPFCEPVHDITLDWEPLTPTVGQLVTFTVAATGTPPIFYTWDLGDGTIAQGETISHSYDLTGTYTVVLTATNPCDKVVIATDITVIAVPLIYRVYLPLVLRHAP